MTKSIEDYLKGIYSLKESKNLSNKSLAEYLRVSPASVSEMMKKLVKEGYITGKNKDVILTEKGNKLALEIIRKHRIWEVFLVQVLHFKRDEMHEEAEKLEHATSIKLLKKLEKFLGYPKKCPHGRPIIYEYGYLNLENIEKLSDLEENDKIVIFKIAPEKELENYLNTLNIHTENSYEIKKIDPFNGPIYLENDSKEVVVVALEAAKLIEVYKIRTE